MWEGSASSQTRWKGENGKVMQVLGGKSRKGMIIETHRINGPGTQFSAQFSLGFWNLRLAAAVSSSSSSSSSYRRCHRRRQKFGRFKIPVDRRAFLRLFNGSEAEAAGTYPSPEIGPGEAHR